MELRQLKVFVVIAEEPSFTRAADRLHVVQSAVSASLRTLEGELGATLVDRSSNPVTLTDAGLALLEEARRTLAAADAAVAAVDEVRGGVRGTVRLGLMQARGGPSVAEALAAFRMRHPAVAVIVRHTGGSADMAAHVRQGALDMAFVGLPQPEATGLVLMPLTREPLAFVCHPEHPFAGTEGLRLADLVDEAFADVPPSWGTRMLTDAAFAAAQLTREVRYEINDVPAVLEFAAHNLAVALMPASAVAAQRLPLRAVPILDAPVLRHLPRHLEGQTSERGRVRPDGHRDAPLRWPLAPGVFAACDTVTR